MWRVSIEAGEAYSGPHLIPGDNDGRAGYSTGGEFVNFHHNLSIIINHSTFFSILKYISTLLTYLLFGIIASLYFFSHLDLFRFSVHTLWLSFPILWASVLVPDLSFFRFWAFCVYSYLRSSFDLSRALLFCIYILDQTIYIQSNPSMPRKYMYKILSKTREYEIDQMKI